MSDFICYNCGKKNYGDYCSRCGTKRRGVAGTTEYRSYDTTYVTNHTYDTCSGNSYNSSNSSDCGSYSDSGGSCGGVD